MTANPTDVLLQGETLEPCWCKSGTDNLSLRQRFDHGDFGCRPRGWRVVCSHCAIQGPVTAKQVTAKDFWNRSRRAAVAGPRGDVRELGADTNFPLSETLGLLVEWAQHLHVSHECDCDGWEQRSFLIEAAQRYRHEIAQAAAPVTNDTESLLTDREAKLVIGAMPMQSLPDDVQLVVERIRNAVIVLSDVEHGDPLLSRKAVLEAIDAATTKGER